LIRHALALLRADVRTQRELRLTWLNERTWTEAQYNQWNKSAMGFTQGINRRLAQIEPLARQLPGETKNYYRRRHSEDTSIIAALTQAINTYLDDDTQSVGILEDALDIVRNFGPENGDMTLFDALEAGMFENRTAPRRIQRTATSPD
jgi:hypothetical protein